VHTHDHARVSTCTHTCNFNASASRAICANSLYARVSSLNRRSHTAPGNCDARSVTSHGHTSHTRAQTYSSVRELVEERRDVLEATVDEMLTLEQALRECVRITPKCTRTRQHARVLSRLCVCVRLHLQQRALSRHACRRWRAHA
jgi:hypothetical protein